MMPRAGRVALPSRTMRSTVRRTVSTGMANPTPALAPEGEKMAVFTPIRRPCTTRSPSPSTASGTSRSPSSKTVSRRKKKTSNSQQAQQHDNKCSKSMQTTAQEATRGKGRRQGKNAPQECMRGHANSKTTCLSRAQEGDRTRAPPPYLGVQQRPSGVPRVYGGIRLHHASDHAPPNRADVPPHPRDDASCQSAVEPEGIAYGQHVLTHLQTL